MAVLLKVGVIDLEELMAGGVFAWGALMEAEEDGADEEDAR